MGAMDARNMLSNLAVNKYLHTVASCWISSTYPNKDLLNSFSKNKDSYSRSMHERNNKKCIQNFVEKQEA